MSTHHQNSPAIISLHLTRIKKGSDTTRVEVEFQLSLLEADVTPLISKRDTKPIGPGEFFQFYGFASRDDVFQDRRSEFLPNGALAVRCQMFKPECSIPQIELCFAQTQMGEQRSFVWVIRDLSTLGLEERRSTLLQMTTKAAPSPLLSFYPSEDEVKIELTYTCHKRELFAVFKISVLDAEGKVVYSIELQRWIETEQFKFLEFPALVTKREPTENKDLFLPSNTLNLK
ncbi:hypothetical protein AVEN_142493-1 [Araneus ventricosus]|uniref:Uncharacterized protein n=1 Tax=Araneus ventricosus TaxID=182803 RepID=A0A4Y2DUH3_ARAVE|nr:hypothetical protein AVEN_142493-1 [Araneus ventricosus]